jgi:hypothetical protein
LEQQVGKKIAVMRDPRYDDVMKIKKQSLRVQLVSIFGLLALFLSGCAKVNECYSITVINPAPRIGSIFLTDPSGEFEVAEVWSKSYFQPTELILRHTMKSNARAVFRGWSEQYPIDNGYSGWTGYYADTILNFEISDGCWMASPRFEWVWNQSPLWIDADTIIFSSNRDSGGSIWKVPPSGGKAERITAPELDAIGNPALAHRLENRRVAYAWRNSPFIAIENFHQGEGHEFEVWNACTRALVAGIEGTEEFSLLSADGDFLWGFSKAESSGSPSNTVLLVQRNGSVKVANGPRAESADYGSNGDGHIVFGLYYIDHWVDDERHSHLARIFAFDSAAGTMTAIPGLEGVALEMMPYRPASLSIDGTSMLMCFDYRNSSGAILGTALAIVRGDGDVAIFPAPGGYLPIVTDGICFSQDGSSIVAKNLSGIWGLYSKTDGSPIASLPDKPVGTSPDFESCLVDSDDAYRVRQAADGFEPGGGGSVTARQNGDNTDIFLIRQDASQAWLTGPESGDAE